ncbi:MAG: stage V sporulation protein AC [Oscillospiraceae bacterium]
MLPQEYEEYNKKISPNTKSYKNIPIAFCVGGLICILGQGLIELYKNMGVPTGVAGTLCSVSLVFISTLMTGLNVYDNIAKYAGAGTLVPITGFANAMAAPAMEFKSEGYILGIGAKIFTIAGPVIVYGLGTSFIYGVIIYLFKLY